MVTNRFTRVCPAPRSTLYTSRYKQAKCRPQPDDFKICDALNNTYYYTGSSSASIYLELVDTVSGSTEGGSELCKTEGLVSSSRPRCGCEGGMSLTLASSTWRDANGDRIISRGFAVESLAVAPLAVLFFRAMNLA